MTNAARLALLLLIAASIAGGIWLGDWLFEVVTS
jgi:hypothetical protein